MVLLEVVCMAQPDFLPAVPGCFEFFPPPNGPFQSKPILPHGLHGIYISRYAKIGKDCRIYQNVTIGSVGKQAPQIGDHCFIGAGAIIIGDIKVGDYVRIGAGSVVNTDVPNYATVVPQPSRIIVRGATND